MTKTESKNIQDLIKIIRKLEQENEKLKTIIKEMNARGENK